MATKKLKQPQEQTLPALDVIATAFAVHRVNEGYFRETRRFSTEGVPTLFSNKEAITYQLEVENKKYNPPDFKRVRVRKADKKHAEEALQWLSKENALNIIAGNLSDFMDSLMKYISSDKLSKNSYGVVAVVPKVYFEGSKKKTIKKKLKTSFRESRHIGNIGQPVTGMFTLNEIKFIDKFTCHVCNGSIDGNLVSFFKNFDQTKALPKEGKTFEIKAKVKRHGENFITKYAETQLNYVRFKIDNK